MFVENMLRCIYPFVIHDVVVNLFSSEVSKEGPLWERLMHFKGDLDTAREVFSAGQVELQVVAHVRDEASSALAFMPLDKADLVVVFILHAR